MNQFPMVKWQSRWRQVCCGIALLLTVPLSSFAVAATSAATELSNRQKRTSPQRLRQLELEQLMEVKVTTVSRTESTVGESAAAVFVITQEDIRRSGATTIAELFRRVPGMNVARIDNNKWAISSRGFNDRYADLLLVQMDGRTVYNPLFAGVYWDTVVYPLEDIERIEVIRGPGASVWGANAVNGVINIITKSAKNTQGGQLSVGGGNQERAFGTADTGENSVITPGIAYTGKASTGWRKQFSEGPINDEWYVADTGARLDWNFGKNDSLFFDATI